MRQVRPLQTGKIARFCGFMPVLAWIGVTLLSRFSALAAKPTMLVPIVSVILLLSFLIRAAVQHPARETSTRNALLGGAAACSMSILAALPGSGRRFLLGIPGAALLMGSAMAAHLVAGAYRGAQRFRCAQGGFRMRIEAALAEMFPARLARLAAAEIAILRYAFAWRMRPDIPYGAQSFSYHTYLQPMMWAFFGLALIEISVVHLLLGLWSRTAAWILFVISDISLLYLVGLINSLRKLPILVTEDGILIRAGILIEQFIPMSNIRDVTANFDAAYVKSRMVLKATLMGHPSLLIELHEPIRAAKPFNRSRNIFAIAIRPDEPGRFLASLRPHQALKAAAIS